MVRTQLVSTCLALLALAAPAQAIELSFRPAAVTLEAERGKSVEVLVRCPAGRPPALRTTWGNLSSLRRMGTGRYKAQLDLPPSSVPRTVVVAASGGGPDADGLAWATLPVSARTQLRARTEPKAEISVLSGEKVLGTTVARRTGRFELELELPPRVEPLTLTLRDRAGNESQKELPITAPPVPTPLVFLEQDRLDLDGRRALRTWVLLTDAEGRPIRRAELTARASLGGLTPFRSRGDGWFEAQWSVVGGLVGPEPRSAELRVGRLSHAPGRAIACVHRSPPHRLDLSAPVSRLGVGESTQLRVTLRDENDRPVAGPTPRLQVDRGTLGDLEALGEGRHQAALTAPVTIGEGPLKAHAVVEIEGSRLAPHHLELTLGQRRDRPRLQLRVTDLAGSGVAGQPIQLDAGPGGGLPAGLVTDDDGRAELSLPASTNGPTWLDLFVMDAPGLRASLRWTEANPLTTRNGIRPEAGRPTPAVELRADLQIALMSGRPTQLVARAIPDVLPADGASTSRLEIELLDRHGNGVEGGRYELVPTRGIVDVVASLGEGQYSTTYTAPDGSLPSPDVILITELGSSLTTEAEIALTLGPPRQLSVSVEPGQLVADASSEASVAVRVSDASGVPIPGHPLALTREGPAVHLAETTGTTGDEGWWTTTLRSGREEGTATLIASCTESALNARAGVTLVPLHPVSLELEVQPGHLLANGREVATLTARLEDPWGRPATDIPVRFTAEPSDLVVLAATEVRSDDDGRAVVQLTGHQPGLVTLRAATVEGGLSDETSLTLDAWLGGVDLLVDSPTCATAVSLRAVADRIDRFEWDFDGDGTTDALGVRVIAPLPAGEHDVTLRAYSDDYPDAVERRDRRVRVHEPPDADVSSRPSVLFEGDCVELDSRGSIAGTAGPFEIEWDFDGNGQFDDDDAVITTTCPPLGTTRVGLRLTDLEGCTDETHLNVLVQEHPVDLRLTTVGAPTRSLKAGELTTWTVAVDNDSLGTARDVVIDLRHHVGLELIDAKPTLSSRAAQGARFRLGELTPGEGRTLEMKFRVGTALTAVRQLAEVELRASHDRPDLNPSDDELREVMEILGEPALALRLGAVSDAAAGESVSYTLEVENLGSAPAVDLRLRHLLDGAIVSSASPLPSGGSPISGGLELVLPDLAAGAVSRVDHVVTIGDPQDLVDPLLTSRLEAQAVATSPPTPASHVLQVLARPELSLDLVLDPDVAAAGGTVTATARLTNIGHAPSSAGTVRFTWPTEMTALTPEDLSHGSLRVGETVELVASARLAATLPTPHQELMVTATQLEQVVVDQASLEATAEAVLDIQLVAAPATLTAGESDEVVFRVANDGTTPATTLRLELLALANGHWLSSSGPAQLITAGLAPGGSVELAFPITVDTELTDCSPLLQLEGRLQAVLGGGAPLTRPVDIGLQASPDLGVTLTLDQTTAGADSAVVARVRVENRGGGRIESPTVTLSHPSLLTVITAPPEIGSPTPGAGVVSGILTAGLGPGESRELVFELVTVSTLPAGSTTAQLTARITGAACGVMFDPTDTATLQVTDDTDLQLALSLIGDELVAGSTLRARLFVTNDGPVQVSDATLALEWPDGLVTLTDPGAGAVSGARWELTGVAVAAHGGTALVEVGLKIADVLPSTSNTLPFVANVASSSVSDSQPANDEVRLERDAVAWAELCLQLTTTATPDPAVPDGALDYELTVTNLGSTAAHDVAVAFRGDEVFLQPIGGTPLALDWLVPTLAVGATEAFSIPTARVVSSLPSSSVTVVSSAEASASETGSKPLCSGRVESRVDVAGVPELRLDLVLTPEDDPLTPGKALLVAATVRNVGSAPAELGGLDLGELVFAFPPEVDLASEIRVPLPTGLDPQEEVHRLQRAVVDPGLAVLPTSLSFSVEARMNGGLLITPTLRTEAIAVVAPFAPSSPPIVFTSWGPRGTAGR
ncbi:MAG: invasin domain 3-containing protein [Acidobacteriota bacterium]